MIIIDDHVGLTFKAVFWIIQTVNATLVMITNNRPVTLSISIVPRTVFKLFVPSQLNYSYENI